MGTLRLVDSYRDDAALREAYFTFIATVFPQADFRTWYNQGWWLDRYRPFSLYDGERICANVSVCEMTAVVNGEFIPAIQLGAVGTCEDCRGRGLSRRLMHHVLDYYRTKPLAFLFANDAVLDFYPKFGFRPQPEVVFRTTRELPPARSSVRKLSAASDDDQALIRSRLDARATPTTLFGARDFAFVTAWHMLNVFPNGISYQEDRDLIWVVSVEQNELHVRDLAWRGSQDLAKAWPHLPGYEHVTAINWYFSPDRLDYPWDSMTELTDSGLFVRGDFPVTEPFKFPATAQT